MSIYTCIYIPIYTYTYTYIYISLRRTPSANLLLGGAVGSEKRALAVRVYS